MGNWVSRYKKYEECDHNEERDKIDYLTDDVINYCCEYHGYRWSNGDSPELVLEMIDVMIEDLDRDRNKIQTRIKQRNIIH